MDTYEKHRAAVRQRCRDAFAEMCENTGPFIVVSVKTSKIEWIGIRGLTNGLELDRFTETRTVEYGNRDRRDVTPGTLLHQINEFAKMPVLMEATFKTAHDKQQETAIKEGATLFMRHGSSPFIYVGFPTEKAALEFRLGPHGDLVMPMPRD